MLLILLVVIGYLAARFAVDWLARHALVVSGAEYLVLGLLLGPRGTGVLTEQQVGALAPFFTLALGWMGASVGFRLWLPVLTRTPGILYRLAFTQSLFTAALVGGGCWLLLWQGGLLTREEAVLPAVALAAIATASTLQGARIASKHLGHRNLAVRLLEISGGVDALFAILILTVGLAIYHVPVNVVPRAPTATEWVVISVAVGVVGGWLFHLFLGDERSPERLFVAIAGAVILTTGAATYIGMSALLPGALLGCILVNTSRQREQVRALLDAVDRPLYFVMLVCAGALWTPSAQDIFAVVMAFLVLRLLGKLAGGWIAAHGNGVARVFSARWGLALVGQGGLAIALALEYSLSPSAVRPNVVFTAALCSVLLTDLLSARLARDVVDRLDEELALPARPADAANGGD